jgi:hypothetical protein
VYNKVAYMQKIFFLHRRSLIIGLYRLHAP